MLNNDDIREMFHRYTYVEDENKIMTPNGRFLTRAQFNSRFEGPTFPLNASGTRTTDEAWQVFLFHETLKFPRAATVPEPLSKDEARGRGLKFYFTGKPCRAGHLARRYASTGNCVECLRERAADLAIVEESASRLRRATKLGNPEIFAGTVRLPHHARFRQLQQAYLHGESAWLADVDSAIEALLSTGSDPATGKPFA